MSLFARAMTPEDVPDCVALINHTIALGGSTAYEEPFTQTQFAEHYLAEPPVSNVAIFDGRVVGFQAAFDVGDGLYSIGSFADQRTPIKGTGRIMFAKTLTDCRAHGGVAILAKITSDNTAGLAYYSSVGFMPWKTVENDHMRPNGQWVDRIIKRFEL